MLLLSPTLDTFVCVVLALGIPEGESAALASQPFHHSSHSTLVECQGGGEGGPPKRGAEAKTAREESLSISAKVDPKMMNRENLDAKDINSNWHCWGEEWINTFFVAAWW